MMNLTELRENIDNVLSELIVYAVRIVLNGGNDVQWEKKYAQHQILKLLRKELNEKLS